VGRHENSVRISQSPVTVVPKAPMRATIHMIKLTQARDHALRLGSSRRRYRAVAADHCNGRRSAFATALGHFRTRFVGLPAP
jgi:hypothetical protein